MSSKAGNNRALVSLLMLFGFLAIVVTGVLSYILRYDSVLSAVHTVFGLLFVGYGVFHLKNNFRPITQYLRRPSAKKWKWMSLMLMPAVILGVMLKLPPFQWVVDAGYAIKELKPIDRQVSSVLYTQLNQKGQQRSLLILSNI